MITIDNYYDATKNFIWTNFPETIQKGHAYFDMATGKGENWEPYRTSESVKRVIDLYLTKLNELTSKKEQSSTQKKENRSSPRPNNPTKSPKTRAQKAPEAEGSRREATHLPQPDMVERIPEELRFIRRFVNMNGKTKAKDEILRFINSLQKAIVEKRIRKTSTWAMQIALIQDYLIDMYNSMKAKKTIDLKPETVEEFKALVGGEKVMASINFIKRYIALNGKTGVKDKAKQLLEQINRAMDKGKIGDDDLYITEIHELKKNLKAFTTGKGTKTLEIEKTELNGLQGILGCACQSYNGLGEVPAVMNSMDFANLKFQTIGFTGKWHDFIGDPPPNFRAMVFGKPKYGKSYLCVDFAGYLARNHGRVLYVAKEEGLNTTLQMKLNETNVKHPNLDVASILLKDFSPYDFIFMDSVTTLKLSPHDLAQLEARYPSKSFIYVFQSTKEGKSRGTNEYQHNVDIVIEVPEPGRAIQYGRFNQGGEMNIFSDSLSSDIGELSGTNRKKKRSKGSHKYPGRKHTHDRAQPFFYVIDHNEKGSFRAHVEDYLGNSIFEIKDGNELAKDETSFFDEGWMSNAEDTSGLKNYLIDVGIIGKGDWVSHKVQYKEQRFKHYNSKRYLQ